MGAHSDNRTHTSPFSVERKHKKGHLILTEALISHVVREILWGKPNGYCVTLAQVLEAIFSKYDLKNTERGLVSLWDQHEFGFYGNSIKA